VFQETGIAGALDMQMATPFRARGSGWAAFANENSQMVLMLCYSNPIMGTNKIHAEFIPLREFSPLAAQEMWENRLDDVYDSEKIAETRIENRLLPPSHQNSLLRVAFKNQRGEPAIGDWNLTWEGLGAMPKISGSLPKELDAHFRAMSPHRRPFFLGDGNPDLVEIQRTQPQRWGMNVHQWFQMLEHCQQTALYKEIKDHRGGIVNFYDICEYFVKPWTAGHGCGVALLMNSQSKGLEPCIMISHGWGADVEQDMECLHNVNRETPIWFCVFANYQCQDGHGPSIQDQLALEPFETVIEFVENVEGGEMLALHTSTADIYERMWCVLEISTALAMKVCVTHKVSRSWATKEISKQHDWGQIRTEDAKCGCPEDVSMLQSKIQKQGGFAALNGTIQDFRVKSLRSQMV